MDNEAIVTLGYLCNPDKLEFQFSKADLKTKLKVSTRWEVRSEFSAYICVSQRIPLREKTVREVRRTCPTKGDKKETPLSCK